MDTIVPASDRFTFGSRVRSFRYAARGIITMLQSQHNAWIHVAATVGTCVVAALLDLSVAERCLIILAIVAVWTAEALNTAFEFLAGVASPGFHPLVERAKDVAAGAVLITAIGAAAIGLVVLVPHIWRLWFGG
jgi:diacylglycerol kinase (ATP)